MGEEKIHSLYLQRKDTSSRSPSVYRTVPYMETTDGNGNMFSFPTNESSNHGLHINPNTLYDLIIGKQSLHDIGAVLDFKEKTITIDIILLPMRNIVNLQLKPSVTRELRHNTCQAQEPVSTRNGTKRVIEILDA
jgi:hypothetical protein